ADDPAALPTTAAGREATAAGREATAAGREATAAGREATAAGREATAAGREATAAGEEATAKWDEIKEFFVVPDEYRGRLGEYRSLLTFDQAAGRATSQVKTPEDWAERREEIRQYWQTVIGMWPELLDRPRMNIVASEQ